MHRHLGDHFLDEADFVAQQALKIFSLWRGLSEDGVYEVEHRGAKELLMRPGPIIGPKQIF